MIPLEAIVCPTDQARQQFQADCKECFGSLAGTRLLATLCSAVHPLTHTPGMTDHQHGNAEVIALLWRYSAKDQITLANNEPKTSSL